MMEAMTAQDRDWERHRGRRRLARCGVRQPLHEGYLELGAEGRLWSERQWVRLQGRSWSCSMLRPDPKTANAADRIGRRRSRESETQTALTF